MRYQVLKYHKQALSLGTSKGSVRHQIQVPSHACRNQPGNSRAREASLGFNLGGLRDQDSEQSHQSLVGCHYVSSHITFS